MNITQKKLDAGILSDTEWEREQAIGELCSLMTSQKEKPDIEWEIHQTLAELGVQSDLLGHDYLVTAIYITIAQPEIVRNIMKELYPAVAEVHHTKTSLVERAMRHAIENAFQNGDPDVLNRYFRNTISVRSGKVTNGAFISRVANILRIQGGVA